MNAAIYARVSKSTGAQSPEMQLRELREFCARRGWTLFGEYVDQASGSIENRSALQRLLSDCRRRRVKVVVVYRYDRFARSLRQLVNALEEFRALNIDFVSLHEGVDTSTPNGRLIFGIFASIAEFERELIRERIKSGLDAARAKGKRLGRPRGISNGAGGLRTEVEDAAQIRALRSTGTSWRAISKQLSIPLGTVWRLGQRAS